QPEGLPRPDPVLRRPAGALRPPTDAGPADRVRIGFSGWTRQRPGFSGPLLFADMHPFTASHPLMQVNPWHLVLTCAPPTIPPLHNNSSPRETAPIWRQTQF